METQKQVIYIVEDDKMVAGVLRRFLLNRFKEKIIVRLYFSGESCLRMMHSGVSMVIIDHYLHVDDPDSKQGVEVLKIIKERFPNTEVIMHTSSEDVAVAVEAMRAGAKDFIVKDYLSPYRLSALVDRLVAQPLRLLVAEFGVTKFAGIFLGTFVMMGIGVALALHFAH